MPIRIQANHPVGALVGALTEEHDDALPTLVGEFRAHYAGFFDPGFGHDEAGGGGTRAVLEVRSHDVPFMIEDGQTIGRLLFEPLTERPAELYGRGIGSSYQRQGLALAKQFRHADPHGGGEP